MNPNLLVDDETLHALKENASFMQDNAGRSYEMADNLSGTAQQAFDLSQKVQSGVTVITDALAESTRQSQILMDHSKKIIDILNSLGEISEKIHVLSINASIVSARAGVLGKGFEVVAKEVRSLAKETENSLNSASGVISDLQKTIETVNRVVKNADQETEHEKSALMTVAGSLQGVILSVEVIREVSSVVKDKAKEQTVLLSKISGDPILEVERSGTA